MILTNVVLPNSTGVETRIYNFMAASINLLLKQARCIGLERIGGIFSVVERIGMLIQAPLAAEIGA
jgi:hypothetical protein